MMKLHKNEVEINKELAENLIEIQCPRYFHEAISQLTLSGTENVMFTLGEDKLIRLPRIEEAVHSLEKESKWLPALGGNLNISIPKVIFNGKPSNSYPFPWLIISKLEGKDVSSENPLDDNSACEDLAQFILNLRSIPAKDGPACSRGMSLSYRDKAVRKSILLLEEEYDTKLLTNLWESSLSVSEWRKEPFWLHGDIHRGNILVKSGKISAILDFGLCGIGDPSCDLMAAWTLLNTKARRKFFSLLNADSDSIKKARGWALSMGILGYPYYRETNPSFALLAKDAMDEIIKDPF